MRIAELPSIFGISPPFPIINLSLPGSISCLSPPFPPFRRWLVSTAKYRTAACPFWPTGFIPGQLSRLLIKHRGLAFVCSLVGNFEPAISLPLPVGYCCSIELSAPFARHLFQNSRSTGVTFVYLDIIMSVCLATETPAIAISRPNTLTSRISTSRSRAEGAFTTSLLYPFNGRARRVNRGKHGRVQALVRWDTAGLGGQGN